MTHRHKQYICNTYTNTSDGMLLANSWYIHITHDYPNITLTLYNPNPTYPHQLSRWGGGIGVKLALLMVKL